MYTAKEADGHWKEKSVKNLLSKSASLEVVNKVRRKCPVHAKL